MLLENVTVAGRDVKLPQFVRDDSKAAQGGELLPAKVRVCRADGAAVDVRRHRCLDRSLPPRVDAARRLPANWREGLDERNGARDADDEGLDGGADGAMDEDGYGVRGAFGFGANRFAQLAEFVESDEARRATPRTA